MLQRVFRKTIKLIAALLVAISWLLLSTVPHTRCDDCDCGFDDDNDDFGDDPVCCGGTCGDACVNEIN